MLWVLRKLLRAHEMIDYTSGYGYNDASVQKALMEAQQDMYRLAEILNREPDPNAALAARAREIGSEIEKDLMPMTYELTDKINSLALRAAALLNEAKEVMN